jgi:hypothetical protein
MTFMKYQYTDNGCISNTLFLSYTNETVRGLFPVDVGDILLDSIHQLKTFSSLRTVLDERAVA